MNRLEQWSIEQHLSEIKIAEDEKKIVWEIPGDNVIIQSKDAALGADGFRHGYIPERARFATQTTSNAFELLKSAKIATHFVRQSSERTFIANKVDMLPVQVVARKGGHAAHLNPRNVVYEMYAKDEANDNPRLTYDFYKRIVRSYKPDGRPTKDTLINEVTFEESPYAISEQQQHAMGGLAMDSFVILENEWAKQNVALVEMQIECGTNQSGNIVIAGVIDNDSWQILPKAGANNMTNLESYRNPLPVDNPSNQYLWVAQATGNFAVRNQFVA